MFRIRSTLFTRDLHVFLWFETLMPEASEQCVHDFGVSWPRQIFH